MVGVFQRGRDEAMQQGLAEGMERGRVEGERAVVQRLLLRRFGELPRSVSERLVGASKADLEAWADKVLDASSLDEVFRPSR